VLRKWLVFPYGQTLNGFITSTHSVSRRSSLDANHFPMQNVLKIRFRMSSVVVAPVIASNGRNAL
jgi:hypothetical protein